VTVTSNPVASISSVPPLCEGETNDVLFTGTAGATATYSWTFGNAAVISGSGAGPYTLQWNSAGQDQVQISVDDNGCIATATIDITVNPIPTSDFMINNSACINNPVNISYSGTATPNATYNWSFSGGTVSGSGSGPYSVVWNASGSYQISLTVTENGCESAPTDLMANVNPLPVVFAGNDQSGCSGTTVNIGTMPVAGEIYSWSPSTNLSNANTSDPVVSLFNSSTISEDVEYILTVTDANGCINNDAVLVTANPLPVIGFSPLPGQCIDNNNFNLSAFANIQGGVNYNWTFTPEASILHSNLQDLNVSYSSIGTYPVLLTADYNGCPSQPYVDSLTIFEMPLADFIPLTISGCEPLTVQFNNRSIGGNTYDWNFGDGGTADVENAIHVFQHAGTYSVSLNTMNIHGCVTDTNYVNLIDVYAQPNGDFIPNPQVANILAPVIQFQNYSSNVLSYMWDFGDSDTSTTWSPNHEYADTGTYEITLMLISPHGCVDTVRGLVRVEDNFSFYVPNAFTPNGDGVNDYFRGYGVAIRNYQMRIYNRWGELVYVTNNYEKPWDGRVNNNDVVQNDVYVYRIDLTDHHGDTHTYVGDVSVIK
jgi:gliding motility-associated-like protein